MPWNCERLNKECYRKILTDKIEPFKLSSVKFEDESVDLMAKYIFDDKILQDRAKNKLEDKIYSLFSLSMGKENGKIVLLNLY